MATFAVAEWAALRSGDPKAPLSYFMRHSLGVSRHPVYKRAGQVVAGSALLWLVTHIYELPPPESLID